MAISVESNQRLDIIDVTESVDTTIPADVENGLCSVYVPHTTAGVIVNEAESGLLEDLETMIRRLVPRATTYRHDVIDDNADAHLSSVLLGPSVTIPITDGRLALGTWQSILFVDCDGPRNRRLEITIVSRQGARAPR